MYVRIKRISLSSEGSKEYVKVKREKMDRGCPFSHAGHGSDLGADGW